MKIRLFFLLGLIILFASCKKDEEISGDPLAKLSYSADSIMFDTVFTSVGSASRRLKIYNPQKKAIIINSIRLNGSYTSAFSLNINGQATNEKAMLKLNGGDSVNVFVKVNINPNNKSTPFLVKDSIEIEYNTTKKSIPLVAYGQNAHFLNNARIVGNTTWEPGIPYVVYQSMTIEEGATLLMIPGTKVLFHNNATMHIKGTLQVTGTKTDSVLFAGDRLEQLYAEEPGQWNGLHFYPSSQGSHIHYAIIKNAIAGITADSLSRNGKPKLLLTNSIIKNMGIVGFLGYQASLAGFNNLFFNCGQYLIYGVGGGTYNLKQNTFAGFNTRMNRKTAAIYFSDFISQSQTGLLELDFRNNLVFGILTNEFVLDKKVAGNSVSATISNNLLKTTDFSLSSNGNFLNEDPLFLNPFFGNFGLNKTSPALKKGADLTADPYFSAFLRFDLKGKERFFPSVLGCYEF